MDQNTNFINRIKAGIARRTPGDVVKTVAARSLRRIGNSMCSVAGALEQGGSPTRSERPLVAKNAALKGIHKGQRAFIIGNGPSLNNQNLELLAGEISFAVNGFWKHEKIDVISPKYYCLLDPLYFDGSEPMKEFIENLLDRCSDSKYILPCSAYGCFESIRQGSTQGAFFTSFQGDITRPWPGDFDMMERLPSVINVVQLGIMVAICMKCSPIYLLGLDHNWLAHNSLEPHFYTGLTVDNHEEAHGDTSRFSYMHKMSCITKLWSGYITIKDVAERNGIEIYNATDGGFLDVFERRRYEDLF